MNESLLFFCTSLTFGTKVGIKVAVVCLLINQRDLQRCKKNRVVFEHFCDFSLKNFMTCDLLHNAVVEFHWIRKNTDFLPTNTKLALPHIIQIVCTYHFIQFGSFQFYLHIQWLWNGERFILDPTQHRSTYGSIEFIRKATAHLCFSHV